MPSTFSVKKHKICQLFSFLVIFFVPLLSLAQQHSQLRTQETVRKGKYYSRQSATVRSQKPYEVMPGFAFTSMSLRISPEQSFTHAYIVADDDTFHLVQDEHQPAEDSLKQANLIIFNKPQKKILFNPGNIRGDIAFSFINTGSQQNRSTSNQKMAEEPTEDSCSVGAVVAQSSWRDGLPTPSYQRLRTQVKHVIVHHAATYNDLTDYANVVKNIYLFHTQDRGWSDIGYNYLIAQDGTIFQGRSPGNQSVDSDNIQGAHFCGQNSGTMGICMLGNYQTAEPTAAAMASLTRLVAWKVDKEGLDPFGESYHPANPDLGTIAGHRDGCSTECPGENLYALLGELRLEVAERITSECNQFVLNVYTNPTNNSLHVASPDTDLEQQIFVYNMQGKKINMPFYADASEDEWVGDYTQLTDGVYIIKIQGEAFSASKKILLLHSS